MNDVTPIIIDDPIVTTPVQPEKVLQAFVPSPRTGKRGALTPREQAFAAALAVRPGRMPPLPPARAVRVLKEAWRLFTRAKELARTKAPRQARARKAAKAARIARRAGR